LWSDYWPRIASLVQFEGFILLAPRFSEGETVETVKMCVPLSFTWLKPGANEILKPGHYTTFPLAFFLPERYGYWHALSGQNPHLIRPQRSKLSGEGN
jgi:hypothetical protein